MEKRYCLQCDDGAVLVQGARDMSLDLDGVHFVVAQVRGWHCPACGECEFAGGEGARYSAAVDAAREDVDKARARS